MFHNETRERQVKEFALAIAIKIEVLLELGTAVVMGSDKALRPSHLLVPIHGVSTWSGTKALRSGFTG